MITQQLEDESKRVEKSIKDVCERMSLTQLYSKRMLACLMYALGEVGLEQAIKIGEHKNVEAFLTFYKNRICEGQKLKVKFNDS